MTRMFIKTTIAILVALPAFATEYIVKYKTEASLFSVQNFSFMQAVDAHLPGKLAVFDIDDDRLGEALITILSNPQVEYAVENVQVKAFRLPPTSTQLKEQWAIQKVNAEKAWQLANNKGNKSVIVAVIDTGMDYNHNNLKSNAIPGYDFNENDNDPMDDTSSKNPGHGTHCAGIIGANGLVTDGVVGISPEVSLLPIRFLGADGSGTLAGGIKALDYAIEKGAKVISNSWGAAVSASQATPLIEAIQRASDAGVIVVNAAANDGKSNDVRGVFPANAKFANTISVAASDINDGKPSWSNYGKQTVDIAAPGLDIMSTIPNNSYRNLSGTSMATPLVSGAVALLAAQNPDITGAQVRSLLQVTGAKVAIETQCDCRVDIGAAMESLINKEIVVVPATAHLVPDGGSQQFSAFNGTAPFTFASTNPEVATINDQGLMTSVKEGETTVTITDAEGLTATSLRILVAEASSGGGGNPPPGGGECPFPDQGMCDIMCGIMPDLPWCSGQF